MANRAKLSVVCMDRDVVNRATQWFFQGTTIYCEQHYSPEPWNRLTQQRSFCTVYMNRGRQPLDVATSSHAAAVQEYILRNWRSEVLPILHIEWEA